MKIKNKKRIILIGGGGHCKACIDVIEQTDVFEIVGIIDLPDKVGQSILGYKIIGTDEEILNFKVKSDYFLLTIGQIGLPKKRKELYEKLKEDCTFAIVISPLAYVSKHSKIGDGTIIMHGAVLNADATVGQNCIINTKALVEHDVKIGNHCHISTGSIVNGGVDIGDDCFFGSGAVSKEYIKIADKAFIKANSIVK